MIEHYHQNPTSERRDRRGQECFDDGGESSSPGKRAHDDDRAGQNDQALDQRDGQQENGSQSAGKDVAHIVGDPLRG